MPDLVTRGELYSRLHAHLPAAAPLLTEFDREVLLRLAAEDAAAAGATPPFRLRPGLLAAMLAFYDELRRRGRTIDALDRNIGDKLEAGRDTDRGAERLLQQTRFLAAAFAAFERRIGDSGRIDEHALRTFLLADTYRSPYRHLVITVADQAADSRGLWPVDFDLLSRIPVSSGSTSSPRKPCSPAGWHERLHDAMPGLDEHRVAGASAAAAARGPAGRRRGGRAGGVRVPRPRGRTGRGRPADQAAGPRAARPIRLERVGVVFQRPLPYLYLARQVFTSARIPYQAADALPLAAEPFAAALDLLFVVTAEDATRASLIALLASPHWSFHDPRQPEIGGPAGSTCQRSIGCCRTRSSSAAGTSWRGCRGLAAARLAGRSREAARWRAG